MKVSTHSLDIMYTRLKKVHKLSHTGADETEKLIGDDYHFLVMLWEICDTMKEWDNLVERFKKANGYN